MLTAKQEEHPESIEKLICDGLSTTPYSIAPVEPVRLVGGKRLEAAEKNGFAATLPLCLPPSGLCTVQQ